MSNQKDPSRKTLCIDFDGVIHRYSKGYHDKTAYDIPMEGAYESLFKLKSQGYRIVIFTARDTTEVVEWLQKHWRGTPLEGLEVTNVKIPALAYVDDRAIRFTNWNDIEKYFL